MTWIDRWLAPVRHEDLDTEDVVDVWSFRALERLAVHEARTKADVDSAVVRGSVRLAWRKNCRSGVVLDG